MINSSPQLSAALYHRRMVHARGARMCHQRDIRTADHRGLRYTGLRALTSLSGLYVPSSKLWLLFVDLSLGSGGSRLTGVDFKFAYSNFKLLKFIIRYRFIRFRKSISLLERIFISSFIKTTCIISFQVYANRK